MSNIKVLSALVANKNGERKLLMQISESASRIVKELGQSKWRDSMKTVESATTFANLVYDKLPEHLRNRFSKEQYLETVLAARSKIAGTKKGKRLGLAA